MLNKIGNKANNLLIMSELLSDIINIPEYHIIPNDIDIEQGVYETNCWLSKNKIDKFSIRSSGIYSMPGMMDTMLECSIDSLETNIKLVRESFNNPRAKLYRKLNNIPEILPGIIIQKMVYGNGVGFSGTGVLCSRNNSGEFALFGEFVENSMGDVLVSNEIDSTFNHSVFDDNSELLLAVLRKLEEHFKEPQEIEFTVENGIFYILQTRKLQFNNLVYIKILNDFRKNMVINESEFSEKIESWLNGKSFKIVGSYYVNYLVATPVSGGICTSDNILIKDKLLNDDLAELVHYDGVITSQGSITSHPAMLCRNLNIPYVIYDISKLPVYFTVDAYKGHIILDPVEIQTLTTINDINEKFII